MRPFFLWLLAGALMAALGGMSWAWWNARAELKTEEAAHALTRKERDDWQATAQTAATRAEGLADTARACLAREAQAQADAAERAAILDAATPRARTQEETEQVVDNETRKRVAARLNRPL